MTRFAMAELERLADILCAASAAEII